MARSEDPLGQGVGFQQIPGFEGTEQQYPSQQRPTVRLCPQPRGRNPDQNDTARGVGRSIDGHIERCPVQITQTVGAGDHDLRSHGTPPRLGPEQGGFVLLGCNEGSARAQARYFDREIPGESRANDISVGDRNRHDRKRSGASRSRDRLRYEVGGARGHSCRRWGRSPPLFQRQQVVEYVTKVAGQGPLVPPIARP